jgi:hypothetical protein
MIPIEGAELGVCVLSFGVVGNPDTDLAALLAHDGNIPDAQRLSTSTIDY